MMDFFPEEVRRNPFPIYDRIRKMSPVLHDPGSGLWMVFDYEGVRRVMTDHETFSSRHGPAEWLVFMDPPRQTKLRGLIAKAFTPKSVAGLEPRIRELSRGLLDRVIERGEMDLAADYSIQLPLRVIAEMMGVPTTDLPLFKRWSDVILDMSYTVPRGAGSKEASEAFQAATGEMNEYLGRVLEVRRGAPREDLLTRLLQAEVDGERLTQVEILGFFQLLLVAGQETTTNLINNAILCFVEHPEQLARLRSNMELLPCVIEEVLRYRSPLQWTFRFTNREVAMGGVTIPAGKVVLIMIGSANRDPKQFADAEKFVMTRDPNPHIAFGNGIHFCMGAPLARLEARIALTDLLGRLKNLRLASDKPWTPRKALHVHGPGALPIQFEKDAVMAPG